MSTGLNTQFIHSNSVISATRRAYRKSSSRLRRDPYASTCKDRMAFPACYYLFIILNYVRYLIHHVRRNCLIVYVYISKCYFLTFIVVNVLLNAALTLSRIPCDYPARSTRQFIVMIEIWSQDIRNCS